MDPGDERARQEAILRKAATLYRVYWVRAAKRFVPPDQAEDLADDLFLKIWCAHRSFPSAADAHRYFLKSLPCAAIDRYRRERPLVPQGDHTPVLPSHGSWSPEQVVLRRERSEMLLDTLDRAVRECSPQEREAYILHLLGMPGHEIANVQGSPESTVRVRISRARRRFHEEFARTFPEEPDDGS